MKPGTTTLPTSGQCSVLLTGGTTRTLTFPPPGPFFRRLRKKHLPKRLRK